MSEVCGRRLTSQSIPRSALVRNKQQTKIIGGRPSIPGNWPWQALLAIVDPVDGPVPECGGTLVDKKFVLTAAQCVYK